MVDHNRVDGAAEQVKGNIKEAVGKVTGNHQTEAEGKADQVAGKVQSKVGEAKDKIRDATKR